MTSSMTAYAESWNSRFIRLYMTPWEHSIHVATVIRYVCIDYVIVCICHESYVSFTTVNVKDYSVVGSVHSVLARLK